MMGTIAEMFRIGVHVLHTTVSEATGAVLAQLGDVVTNTPFSDNAELWGPPGLVAIPPKAEAGKEAAGAISLRAYANEIILAIRDLRGLKLAGALKPGETCLFGGGADGKAQGRLLIKEDGSVFIFTKEGNEDGGTGMVIALKSDGSISLANPKGCAVLLESDGGVKVFNASGAMQITPSGKIKLASKEKVDISAPGVTIGGLDAKPLASGPEVVLAIESLQQQISALATGLTGVEAHTPGAAATAAAVTTPGALTVGGLVSQIPTKRVAAD